jgi:adenylylsulfate kinase-like enzyme
VRAGTIPVVAIVTPVLWLCGPSGVGKTTVAWEVYSQLLDAGVHVGFADIDQLGMCFPEPASDPGRYRIKAQNLGAVVAGFRAAGARCVVVSGVVDPVRGAYVDNLPNLVATMCRLRADPDELTRRLIARQGDGGMVASALAEADALDASDFSDLCIDTTALSVAEVVRLVGERITDGWTLTEPDASDEPAVPAERADGSILWLCGSTGVGKSTVGFDLYMKHVLGSQIPGAFLDLDQIGFYHLEPTTVRVNHQMRARILADIWGIFRAGGAQCLTLVGPAEDKASIRTYAEALPATKLKVCRLHAGRDELTRRVLSRGHGGSWAQPGDPLKGQPAAALAAVAERAATDADALERAAVGDLRVDTDAFTVGEVADAIVGQTGWPTRWRDPSDLPKPTSASGPVDHDDRP